MVEVLFIAVFAFLAYTLYYIIETIVALLGLFTLFATEIIFPCHDEKIYRKQWIPIIGIFYSLKLRKEYGYKKGYVFDFEYGEFVKQ
jgi:hypothetical protein